MRVALFLFFCTMVGVVFAQSVPANPQINADEFLTVTVEALRFRQDRRISESEFMRMGREPGTIVLDARSTEKFREMHVAGAINLSFPDLTAASLARVIPNKTTRVLIYCNNNFANEPSAFASKKPSASLNLSTFTALYNYGYRNVYELGPYLDIDKTKMSMVKG